MKFSGKMCFKIILKVTKNQGSTLSREDTFFIKSQEGGINLIPPGILGLREKKEKFSVKIRFIGSLSETNLIKNLQHNSDKCLLTFPNQISVLDWHLDQSLLIILLILIFLFYFSDEHTIAYPNLGSGAETHYMQQTPYLLLLASVFLHFC